MNRKAYQNTVAAVSLFFVMTLAVTRECVAWPSLAGEDTWDIVVRIGNSEEQFTVIRDGQSEHKWYYVQNRPRLVVTAGRPELHLIHYLSTGESGTSEEEFGLLQFSVQMGIGEEETVAIKKEIAGRTSSNPESITLSSIPVDSAQVSVYAESEVGEYLLLGSGGKMQGVAALFGSQHMGFMVPLTAKGTSIYRELIDGNTGILVSYVMNFQGLTPRTGYEVIYHWEQIHKQFSRDEDFRGMITVPGTLTGEIKVDHTKIRDELERRKCIEMKVIQGEHQDFQATVDGILTRINTEIGKLQAPEKISPATAASLKGKEGVPDVAKDASEGVFGSIGYSLALKDVEFNSQSSETTSYSIRNVVSRRTVAEGFVGLQEFPESVRKDCETTVKDRWTKTHVILPDVDMADLNRVKLDMQMFWKDRPFGENIITTWSPDSAGWTTMRGVRTTFVAFPLLEAIDEIGRDNLGELVLQSMVTIESPYRSSLELMYSQSIRAMLYSGLPLDLVDVVTMDVTDLSWDEFASVRYVLEDSLTSVSGHIYATRNADGTYSIPRPIHIPFAKSEVPIRAEVYVTSRRDGRERTWRRSQMNARDSKLVQVLEVDVD